MAGPEHPIVVFRLDPGKRAPIQVEDDKRTENHHSDERNQESRPSLQPSLVPKHRSILLYAFQENLPQSYCGHVNRTSLEVAGARDHVVGILVGDHSYLVATGLNVLDAFDLKFLLRWR